MIGLRRGRGLFMAALLLLLFGVLFPGEEGRAEEAGGQAVTESEESGEVYVSVKSAPIYIRPEEGEESERLSNLLLGARLTLLGICDNGFSHVRYEGKSATIEGYTRSSNLGSRDVMVELNDSIMAVMDTDILDYPGRKEGSVIGEVLEYDMVHRTGTFDGVWSRIRFEDQNGEAAVGYIPSYCLEGLQDVKPSSALDASTGTGTIHESNGQGIFAEAVESVSAGVSVSAAGVLIGNPEALPANATLTSLGVFRITHYCPCSICCGPYTDGITSTGVTAVTNHTIAVDPSQIPYGSRVLIGDTVYYAEDCGGAIVTNCIDVYVASHEEALARGVVYTEVYLVS